MVSALNSRELMKDWLAKATPGEIENWADIGLRHKSGVKPEDRLRRFINIARHFGYATRDDSWGEFEKMFCIMVKRLVVAERDLETLRAEIPMCMKVMIQGEIIRRCDYCGVEDPTHADLIVCREKPCRLVTPQGDGPTKEQANG